MNEESQFTQQTPSVEIPPIEQPQEEDQKHHNGFSPAIGIILIVALLLFGAFYFWGAKLNINTPQENIDTTLSTGADTQQADAITEQLQTQSDSIDPIDIEDDLDATDLGDFEAELDDLDSIFAE